MPPITDPNLIVGLRTPDDAAIYRLTDDISLVQTVDFFPPIVDDPYDYGAIAVANAVSDIYAMGAKPLLALNIVAFPRNSLSLDVLTSILRGGMDKATEAGLLIVGGHSIVDEEPKYGLAVTGILQGHPAVTIAGAQPGDELVLTKPIGVGVITTALKAEVASPQAVARATMTMKTLNKAAAEVMLKVGVNACTDITGFGLLGHLKNMLDASGVGATVFVSQVPVIPEAWELVEKGCIPGGTERNLDYVKESVDWHHDVSAEAQTLLADPQTSGGLLLAVPGHRSAELQSALADAGVAGIVIGAVTSDPSSRIRVLP